MKDNNKVVIASAIVWDKTDSHVYILTNYHTWVDAQFKYCFPPKKSSVSAADDEADPVHLTLSN